MSILGHKEALVVASSSKWNIKNGIHKKEILQRKWNAKFEMWYPAVLCKSVTTWLFNPLAPEFPFKF